MDQNIIELGFNVAEFSAQQKIIYEDTLKTYALLKEMDGFKIGVGGASAGWADLKNQAAGLEKTVKELQEANVRLTQAIADGNAVQKETVTIQKQTNASMDALIKKMNDSKAALKANSELQKQLIKDVKAGKISADEYRQSITQLTSTQLKYEQTLKMTRAEIRQQLSETFSPVNEYKKLSKAYADAALAYKNYSIRLGEGHPVTIQAKADANALAAQVKQLDENVGQSQRNVGNYPTAMNKIAAGASNAFNGLRKLAYLIPGLGLAGLIGLLIEPIVFFFKEIVFQASEAEKKITVFRDIAKAAADASKEQVALLGTYKIKLNDVSLSEADRLKIAKEYNKTADETNKLDLAQINNLGLINEKIERQNQLILARAISNAALAKIGESAAVYVDKKTDAERLAKELGTTYDALEKSVIANRITRSALLRKVLNDDSIKNRDALFKFDESLSKAYKGKFFGIGGADDIVEQSEKAKSDMDKMNDLLQSLITVDGLTTKDKKEKQAKEQMQIADKSAEEILKINFEMNKRHIEAEIDKNKRIIDSDQTAYYDRLLALENFNKAKLQLIEAEREFAVDSENLRYNEVVDKLKKDRKDPDNNDATRKKIDDQIAKEKEVHLLKLINLESKYYDEIRRQGQDYLADIRKAADDEWKIKKDFMDQERDYEEWTANQIKDIQKRVSDEKKKKDKEEADRAKAKAELIYNFEKEFANRALTLVQTLLSAGYDRQKKALQELVTANNDYESAELKRIQNSTVSEQEKAAMVIQVNAQVASKNKQLAEEQRQIDIKKAKLDKDMAIARIILNTAMAATNAMTTGDPYTAGLRAGIVIALGAAELAIAVATPIPTYSEGTEYHPGGYAIYGDVPEMVHEPGKAAYLANKTKLGILPEGTKVRPLTGDYINESINSAMIRSWIDAAVVDNRLGEIKDAIIETGRMTEAAIRKSSRGNVNVYLDGNFGNYLSKKVIN